MCSPPMQLYEHGDTDVQQLQALEGTPIHIVAAGLLLEVVTVPARSAWQHMLCAVAISRNKSYACIVRAMFAEVFPVQSPPFRSLHQATSIKRTSFCQVSIHIRISCVPIFKTGCCV